MAKQTFTTGQVLTAAQMTSLQQTAMGGGSATAKTVSYVLVAADAGTVVQMNSATATTITLNTALFAAGDTVQIQNVGAGVCTVTAGTATVNTSSTLALKQYDAGSLYFNSTSAAIFFASDAADSTSPLTTKGDLYTFSTLDARLGVGANDTILTADSTASTGLKWAAAAGGSANWSLLNSGGTDLTGAATVTVSGISGKDKIMVLIGGASSATASSRISVQLNADTASNYYYAQANYSSPATYATNNLSDTNRLSSGDDEIMIGSMSSSSSSIVSGYVLITGCNSAGVKVFNSAGSGEPEAASGQIAYWNGGYYNSATVISSVSVRSTAGNLDAGKVFIYTSA